MPRAGTSFTRSLRLRRPQEFSAVMKGGKRIHTSMLTAVAKTNTHSTARLGLAISARSVPRAPDRNRIKRIARESFRGHRSRIGNIDIVITARKGAGEARRAALHEAFASIWKRLERSS